MSLFPGPRPPLWGFLLAAMLAIVVLAAFAWGVVWGASSTTAPPSSTLADRINGACRHGYQVSDWTVGDEYDPIPAGVVQVVCVRIKQPFDLYTVAVVR